MLSIPRSHRYIAPPTEPGAARDFFREIGSQIDSFAVKWHRFDLEKIDHATDEVLVRLEA